FENKETQDAIVTYYMLPRPDGADAIVEECASKGPNATRFESLYLCEEPESAASNKYQTYLSVINNLSMDDALLISTFLHQTLRFEATKRDEFSGTTYYDVWPYVHERDWIEICKTGAPVFSQGNVKRECERASSTSKNMVSYAYAKEEAEGVAKAMNSLYGIAPQ
ncbi:MAG: hypothetical protein KBF88_11290, partial [Polyangiaceae bacterium]|nr:hypothetical protein [Polyangiaceae bacterium]